MKTIKIHKKTLTVLFPDLLRELHDTERQALKNDIRKRGVIVPVIVDEDGGIIDGINRATIVAELGIPGLPTQVIKGMSPESKRDLALALNDARRHLTPADRKKVKEQRKERVAEKRAEGKTLEQIAKEEGVSHVQVIRDLKEADAESVCTSVQTDAPTPPPAPERVTGKDGKSYPARKPRKERPAEGALASAAAVAATTPCPRCGGTGRVACG